MSGIPILGPTRVKLETAQQWALASDAHDRFVNTIIPLLYKFAPMYGVAAENLVVQSAHETAFGHYTGVVPASYNNPGGIKTAEGGGNYDPNAHQQFDSWEQGCEAKAQHVAKYGGNDVIPEGREELSPRLHLVETGSAPYVRDLGGKYAPSPTYGERLETKIQGLIDFAAERDGLMSDIPGVPFVAADSRHYTPGREVDWPDLLIQHHTEGTDSLGWLTTDPNSNVSSTYLLWHSGKIRAQLVRHEDTPHTTAAYNPRSISIEWERNWPEQSHISGEQYRNIASAWARVVAAERARGNPHFQGTPKREQLQGHNDFYDTICPGNLDLDRVYRLMVGMLEDADRETSDPCRYFEATSHFLCHGFRGFWEDNGGLSIFGYPLSEEFDKDGMTIQWFERARFEYQPNIADNPHGVVLGLIGAESRAADEAKHPDAFAPQDPPEA